ncbi:MAG: 1-aminocyclopropane-1-carboxylate deaminase/D-cysteine desulfhydrase [Aquificaceae bacterium]|nr:MAG: 1-aminocyclopropane-1-carboxylate deaminase/D-cysteine desulfhydrase [Aquificaceae bacterium]
MLNNLTLAIESISLPIAKQMKLSLQMVRADKIHPLASGNKLYKLQPNIDYIKQQCYQQLLSFGGAFSNHIHALALYAESLGLHSIGIIRGEKEYANNPTLSAASKAGMTLLFVDRSTYRLRHNKDYLQTLQQQYPKAFIIPEGGSNTLALQGCTVLMQQINQHYLDDNTKLPDVISVACGTGTTFAGLVKGTLKNQSVQGYLVLKDKSVYTTVDKLLGDKISESKHAIQSADFGGYAKFDSELLDFILAFLKQTNILLDPIYTSKMCRQLLQNIEEGKFKSGSRIAIVHSGGLQAWYGMKNKVRQLGGEAAWEAIANKL